MLLIDEIMDANPDKLVLKIFGSGGAERRAHNCYLCQIYKREAAKGDAEALSFYKSHINGIVRKYDGATIVFNMKRKVRALPRGVRSKP